VLGGAGLPVSLALLFPGQGTQHAAMLPWLDASTAEALQPLVGAFGAQWRARLADGEALRRNALAQPLVTAIGIAAWRALAPLLPAPAVVAGYSVGELAAFHVAGVFGADEAMTLARQRAELMDASSAGIATGLMSIADTTPATIERLCRAHALAVAIRFAPDRVVVGGPIESLDAAAAAAVQLGVTTVRLAVSVASHTPWMSAAVAPFAALLEALPFARPRLALVCDHEAGVLWQAAPLRRALASQIAATVHWDDCMEAVRERGATCVLEMGAGNALSRLWNAQHPTLSARSVDEFTTAAAIARWVENASA
jgi:[acyl-carrier-protein] S-malonyltransferase